MAQEGTGRACRFPIIRHPPRACRILLGQTPSALTIPGFQPSSRQALRLPTLLPSAAPASSHPCLTLPMSIVASLEEDRAEPSSGCSCWLVAGRTTVEMPPAQIQFPSPRRRRYWLRDSQPWLATSSGGCRSSIGSGQACPSTRCLGATEYCGVTSNRVPPRAVAGGAVGNPRSSPPTRPCPIFALLP